MGGGRNIPPVGTARDVVYHVMMPDDVMELHVSVDPAAGADPRIAVGAAKRTRYEAPARIAPIATRTFAGLSISGRF